jgi:hypothetical protein
LRTLTGLKVIIVAIVWAGVTAILPALESETVLSKTIWITFFQRVLLVIVLMIPFEIRDLKFDKEALGTMPQKWGVKKTKFVGLVLLILVLTIENFKNVVSVSHISALLATCFILGVVIRMTRKKQSEYFAALWVESIPIIYFVLLKLLSHFLL